jgi:hypothetical protein
MLVGDEAQGKDSRKWPEGLYEWVLGVGGIQTIPYTSTYAVHGYNQGKDGIEKTRQENKAGPVAGSEDRSPVGGLAGYALHMPVC